MFATSCMAYIAATRSIPGKTTMMAVLRERNGPVERRRRDTRSIHITHHTAHTIYVGTCPLTHSFTYQTGETDRVGYIHTEVGSGAVDVWIST